MKPEIFVRQEPCFYSISMWSNNVLALAVGHISNKVRDEFMGATIHQDTVGVIKCFADSMLNWMVYNGILIKTNEMQI